MEQTNGRRKQVRHRRRKPRRTQPDARGKPEKAQPGQIIAAAQNLRQNATRTHRTRTGVARCPLSTDHAAAATESARGCARCGAWRVVQFAQIAQKQIKIFVELDDAA